jgi:L-iditol 2-dehydrogenase
MQSTSRPLLGGHELAGEVAAIGPGTTTEVSIGSKVAVRRMGHCGFCRGCREGGQCASRHVGVADTARYFGPQGLGEYLTVPASQAVSVGPSVDFVEAALVEPLSCVVRSVQGAEIDLGDDVLVFGAGFMGVLHARVARLRGARVLLAEPRRDRRNLAAAEAARVLDPGDPLFVTQVDEITGGGPRVVFVTGGGPAAIEQAMQLVADRGRVIVFAASYPPGQIEVEANQLHHREVRLGGTVGQSADEFFRAALLISRGVAEVESLISAVYPLDQLEVALKYALEEAPYRVVIEIGGS